MNAQWVQVVMQWGGFGLIAFFFYLFLRKDWKRQDVERTRWDAKEQRWDTVLTNHMSQNSKLLERLDVSLNTNTHAIEELTRELNGRRK